MTRETKVGLVVATSFLGLVGVVVAARMSTTEVPATKRLADAKTEKKVKPVETSPAHPADKKDGKGENKGENKVVTATHEVPGGKASTETSTPPPLNLNISGPLTEPVLAPKQNEVKPAVTPPPVIDAEQQKKLDELKKQTLLAQGPPPTLKEPPTTPLPGDLSKTTPPGTAAPSTGPEKKLEVKPETTTPNTKPEVKPETTTPNTKPEGPGPLPKPDLIETKPGAIPDSTTKPPVSTVPGPETKPSVANPEVKPANTTPGAPPPLGATPSVSSPPISVMAAGQNNNNSNTLPQVKQYDISAYSIKADDRSFGEISQKLYGSDKYARALVLFNRDHPQATEGIRQEPPQLRPGTPVFFPPKEELERNYAPAIAVATPTTPASPANSSAITVGTPTPLPATTPGNPNGVTSAPPGTNVWTEPGGGKNYRVNNNGEHIFEIARNTLGDGSRWSEIYRLNPTINPQFPVPAGTVLKLP